MLDTVNVSIDRKYKNFFNTINRKKPAVTGIDLTAYDLDKCFVLKL